ncbi:lysophospholipase [Intrasporangium calvum]|uniref:Lysophospholipase n=1 Tax=Intrasporangium calvum TaxID=53358 RepID=A0ABT5GI12_9MICO|nr:alpha/beta fold hydrolase [Intrasporangium calvum]MDC5697321.1 lysophospholipase [Intrasporangium calvum]
MTTIPAPEKPSASRHRPPVPTRRHHRHWLRRLVITVVALLLVVLGVGGWYFSGRIYSGALQSTPGQPLPGYDDVEVVAVTGSQVTLKKGPDANEAFDSAGRYALVWEGGHGLIGPATSNPDGSVTRDLVVVSGTAPSIGQQAGLERAYWLASDTEAMGLTRQDVLIGEAPAWYFPNGAVSPQRMAIFVHGQNGIRENGLRFVDVAQGLALPVLDITYRNDLGAPKDPSGRLQYGATEWADLDAAVAWAMGRGASDIVLVGQSMGGAIVAAFLENSDWAAVVSRVVLDAPMLSLGDAVKHGARAALPGGLAVPDPILWSAQLLTTWRYGVDWAAVDYLDDASWLRVPALVTHGTEDGATPVSTSQRLVDARPGLVRLVEFPDALHTESWNFDPMRWNQEVADFLRTS